MLCKHVQVFRSAYLYRDGMIRRIYNFKDSFIQRHIFRKILPKILAFYSEIHDQFWLTNTQTPLKVRPKKRPDFDPVYSNR